MDNQVLENEEKPATEIINAEVIEINLADNENEIIEQLEQDELETSRKDFEKKEEAVFSKDEVSLQNKNREYRQMMIDHLMKNGVPESSRDIRLVSELIAAQETSINTRAGTRLKNKEIDQGGVDKQLIAGILQNITIDGYNVDKETVSSGREERTGLTPQLVAGQLSHGSEGLAEEILGKSGSK